jgi:hypothetical protein
MVLAHYLVYGVTYILNHYLLLSYITYLTYYVNFRNSVLHRFAAVHGSIVVLFYDTVTFK